MSRFVLGFCFLISQFAFGSEVCGVPQKIGANAYQVYFVQFDGGRKHEVVDDLVSVLTTAMASGLKVCLVGGERGYWRLVSIEK